MRNTEFRTPGQLIASLLEERQWTQRVLAIIIEMDETGLNHIIAGKRPVTAALAIALGEIFGVDAEQFVALQRDYDLATARITALPDPNRAARAHLFGELPVTHMIKRRWIDADNIRDVPKVESELAKFFRADSVDKIETLPHAAKKTKTFAPVTPPQLTWIYRTDQIAREMLVAKYSPSSVRHAVSLFSSLLSAPEESRKVPRILAECGIRYVIVETLPTAKIDGVCFWLNDVSPVIGMSLRYDRIDNFWFVLRHEMEHVLREHGKTAIMLDAELEGDRAGTGPDIAEEERLANEAAAEFCVPAKKIEAFIARKAPFFNERDILALANILHVHPGLVAGQLQNKTGRYDRFRQHLSKIRFAVTPGAMVDGWGDVAPVGI